MCLGEGVPFSMDVQSMNPYRVEHTQFYGSMLKKQDPCLGGRYIGPVSGVHRNTTCGMDVCS